MSRDQNVAVLERAVANFNEGNLDGYMEVYGEDLTLHGYPPGVEGKQGAHEFYTSFRAAFPDGQLSLDDILGEGDKLAVRFSLRGTHEAEILGVPATGNSVEITGQTILRFDDGRVVERWQAMDALGLLVQLGAVPPPG